MPNRTCVSSQQSQAFNAWVCLQSFPPWWGFIQKYTAFCHRICQHQIVSNACRASEYMSPVQMPGWVTIITFVVAAGAAERGIRPHRHGAARATQCSVIWKCRAHIHTVAVTPAHAIVTCRAGLVRCMYACNGCVCMHMNEYCNVLFDKPFCFQFPKRFSQVLTVRWRKRQDNSRPQIKQVYFASDSGSLPCLPTVSSYYQASLAGYIQRKNTSQAFMTTNLHGRFLFALCACFGREDIAKADCDTQNIFGAPSHGQRMHVHVCVWERLCKAAGTCYCCPTTTVC